MPPLGHVKGTGLGEIARFFAMSEAGEVFQFGAQLFRLHLH